MKKLNLYLFSKDFFSDDSAIKDFTDNVLKTINSIDNIQEKNAEALTQAYLANNLSKNATSKKSRDYFTLLESHLIHFVAYRTDDADLYEKAKAIILSYKKEDIPNSLQYIYSLLKGEILYNYYNLKLKNELVNPNSLKDLDILFQAKDGLVFIINDFLDQKLSLDIFNVQKVILLYSLVLGHLNRFVEPFYLLDLIQKKNEKISGSVYLGKYLLAAAIQQKTCDDRNPLLITRLLFFINQAKSSEGIDKRNFEHLDRDILELNAILEKYEKENSITKDQLKSILHEGKEFSKNLSKYQKFILKNHLFLNEHSLYCSCEDSIIDNLKISSACKHTKIKEVEPFQLMLESLKVKFINARKAFYNGGIKTRNGKNIQDKLVTNIASKDILLDDYTGELINSFSMCFSILDRIVNAINYAFQIIEDGKKKNIYFNSFFERKAVRKLIENEDRNLFLIALYSLSQDLNKNNPSANFKEYKDWRNAMEHDQFHLIKEDTDVSSLKKKYPNVEFFIPFQEFKSKALFMLHFTRSAIFTYTWAIRKASIKWDQG